MLKRKIGTSPDRLQAAALISEAVSHLQTIVRIVRRIKLLINLDLEF